MSLLDIAFHLFCRHQWVRDRGPKGELVLRCMKCSEMKEHDMLRVLRWRPPSSQITMQYDISSREDHDISGEKIAA